MLLNNKSNEDWKNYIMSDFMDFDRGLTGTTLTQLRQKLEQIEYFCLGKYSQSFEYLTAYNPMNYISLSCQLYVDGKNDIVFRPKYTLPSFKTGDSNLPLELYKKNLFTFKPKPPHCHAF